MGLTHYSGKKRRLAAANSSHHSQQLPVFQGKTYIIQDVDIFAFVVFLIREQSSGFFLFFSSLSLALRADLLFILLPGGTRLFEDNPGSKALRRGEFFFLFEEKDVLHSLDDRVVLCRCVSSQTQNQHHVERQYVDDGEGGEDRGSEERTPFSQRKQNDWKGEDDVEVAEEALAEALETVELQEASALRSSRPFNALHDGLLPHVVLDGLDAENELVNETDPSVSGGADLETSADYEDALDELEKEGSDHQYEAVESSPASLGLDTLTI